MRIPHPQYLPSTSEVDQTGTRSEKNTLLATKKQRGMGGGLQENTPEHINEHIEKHGPRAELIACPLYNELTSLNHTPPPRRGPQEEP